LTFPFRTRIAFIFIEPPCGADKADIKEAGTRFQRLGRGADKSRKTNEEIRLSREKRKMERQEEEKRHIYDILEKA